MGTDPISPRRKRSTSLAQLGNQLVVFGVRPDPEPDHVVVIPDSYGAPAKLDTDRVDRERVMNFLEPERGVCWILAPSRVGIPRLALDSLGQRIKCFSEPLVDARTHASE